MSAHFINPSVYGTRLLANPFSDPEVKAEYHPFAGTFQEKAQPTLGQEGP